jgi:hypothetical protein
MGAMGNLRLMISALAPRGLDGLRNAKLNLS